MPDHLVTEVGETLAMLIAEASFDEHADLRQRRVVRGGPVYKANTFMREPADLDPYKRYFCSTFAVVEKLAQKGVLTAQEVALSANVRETRSTQRIRVGRRQRKRTCWDCEREWKRMVVPLEPGRPSEARQLLRTHRPLRRRFSPSYKLRIVEEADRCTEPGEVGQLLRREGLYRRT